VQDKVEWQQQYYPDVTVRFGPFAVDKKKFCKGNDILVDDRKSNIDDWLEQGGTTVTVTADYNQALKELQEIFDNLRARA
jgi:5'(3')-deoxyribonucleotidase